MKKYFGLFIVIWTFGFASFVCADEKVHVGYSLPLSGALAPMGEAFKKGVDLYFEDHAGDRAKISVVYDDHRYDGKAAVSSCQKFISVDKVNFLVVWGNTPAGVCAPIAERAHAPTLVLSMNPDALDRTYVTSLGPNMGKMVAEVVKYFKTQTKAKNPAAVTINIGNALEAVKLIKEGLGGKLFEKVVMTEEQDFRTIIAVLKSQNIDAAMLFLLPEQAMSFARQAAELNFIVPIVGGDVFADDEFRRNFSGILPSLSLVYGAADTKFVDRLRAKYGNASYFFESACGYAVMELISRSIAGRSANEPLLAALKRVNTDGTPVLGLEMKRDAEYGTHFETGFAIY